MTTSPLKLYVNTDIRWTNPFGNDLDRFNQWIIHQDDLISTLRKLVARGYELDAINYKGNADHLDVYRDILSKPHKEPIFVFGSNLAGIHGSGAAKFAKDYCGAIQYKGSGLMGNSYALPTKDKRISPLPLSEIDKNINEFIEFAALNNAVDYEVTRVGCGRAGYTDKCIAAIFKKHMSFYDKPFTNIHLPLLWTDNPSPSIVIAGGRDVEYGLSSTTIGTQLPKLLTPDTTIVVGGARGVDFAGERFAVENGISFKRIPANWEMYGKLAGLIRNERMGLLSTGLFAIWDGLSKGTKMMIDIADASGHDIIINKI